VQLQAAPWWHVISAFLCGLVAAAASAEEQARSPTPEAVLAKQDRNGDGVVARDEWQSSRPFERYDTDGDGVITLDELRLVMARRAARPTPEMVLAKQDRDGNGVITRTEWDSEQPFERFDADEDGVITLAELQRTMGHGTKKRQLVAPVRARLHYTFPNASFTRPSGETFGLWDLQGRVVLLIPFATWCPPCVASVPKYAELWHHYRDHPQVSILIFNFEDGYEAAVWQVRLNGGDGVEVLNNGNAGGSKIATRSGVSAPMYGKMPQAWLIDRRGIVVQERTSQAGYNSFKSAREMAADIERVVAGLPVQTDFQKPVDYDREKWIPF